mmetsp:Transcript_113162/g.325372  ORF Transcript_113162/g.325372 Transcript_113162/m.325372 type:complete len:218 (+) Transcript_113162:1529-2182(+)
MCRNSTEIALAQVFDWRVRRQNGLEYLPEVFDEDVLCLVGAAEDGTPIGRNLLRFLIQLNLLAVVLDGDTMGLVVRREHESMVFEAVPLLCASRAGGCAVCSVPPSVHRLVVLLGLEHNLPGLSGSRLLLWPFRRRSFGFGRRALHRAACYFLDRTGRGRTASLSRRLDHVQLVLLVLVLFLLLLFASRCAHLAGVLVLVLLASPWASGTSWTRSVR